MEVSIIEYLLVSLMSSRSLNRPLKIFDISSNSSVKKFIISTDHLIIPYND